MDARVSRRRFLGHSAVGGAAWVTACSPSATLPRSAVAPAAPAESLMVRVFGTRPEQARLAWNENPYGPSPRVRAVVEAATQLSGYYADEASLQRLIAERHRLPKSQVTIANGSIENLAAVGLAWGKKGAILCPDLYWDKTTAFVEAKGVAVRRVPLRADMQVDLAAIEAAVDAGVSFVHLCNPNNPTGLVSPPDELKAFCRRVSARVPVLVDEAYNELTDAPEENSVVELVREGHDVMVSRTFSKIYGMAGMRVGYMLSTPENVDIVNEYKVCSLAAPSLAAALAAYEDDAFLAYSKSKLSEARQLVSSALAAAGLRFLPSQTNFLYVDVQGDAELFRAKMEERGILIRGAYGKYTQWSRVSMGRLEDVERYARALPEVSAEVRAASSTRRL